MSDSDLNIEKKGRRGPARPSRAKRLVTVRDMIRAYSDKIIKGPENLSLTDFIRLIGLESELADAGAQVREVKATWVQPSDAESDT